MKQCCPVSAFTPEGEKKKTILNLGKVTVKLAKVL